MMALVVMLLLLLAALVGQLALPSHALLAQVKPPLLLGLVLYYALNRPAPVMLAAAFFGGFLQDAMSHVPLGCSSAVFCAAGWIAARYRGLVQADSAVTPMFFGACAGALAPLPVWALLAHQGALSWGAWLYVWRAAATALLGALAAPVVFVLAGWLERSVGIVEVKEGVHEIGAAGIS